jgi:hypothetical protein
MLQFLTGLSLFLSFWYSPGKGLSFEPLSPSQYMMRVHPDGHSLLRSPLPHLDPWLPHRQFGWLITDYQTLYQFFEPEASTERYPAIDFDQYFVLALIRHDNYPWQMEVQSVIWDRHQPLIEVAYHLIPAGKKRKDPVLSCQLILVAKDKYLRQMGIHNISFGLQETILNNDPDVPNYGLDPAEMIFPPAFTLEDLLQQNPPSTEPGPAGKPEKGK